ncbi:hypothetical protein KIL84_009402 [Mauremys mutica]|uniref:Uncharacterized protein n=1 Tax=Mauremys mutica TaxID=74926 RepID=A0A9D3XIV2_9SAUR|nr:hypothetical protein KIL84_009402 [Mauremys mutica]
MIYVFEEWHKVIQPCWHSQRKRCAVDAPFILLQHSKTKSRRTLSDQTTLPLVASQGQEFESVQHGGAENLDSSIRVNKGAKPGLYPSPLPQIFQQYIPPQS